MASPIDTVRWSSCPPVSNTVSRIRPSSRCATVRAPRSSVSGISSANSSPPTRASRSTRRTRRWAAAESCCNTRSPAGCPSVSLTTLKWSMSISARANGWSYRATRSSSYCRRPSKKRRFLRPVSSSTTASSRRSMFCSWSLRRVSSRAAVRRWASAASAAQPASPWQRSASRCSIALRFTSPSTPGIGSPTLTPPRRVGRIRSAPSSETTGELEPAQSRMASASAPRASSRVLAARSTCPSVRSRGVPRASITRSSTSREMSRPPASSRSSASPRVRTVRGEEPAAIVEQIPPRRTRSSVRSTRVGRGKGSSWARGGAMAPPSWASGGDLRLPWSTWPIGGSPPPSIPPPPAPGLPVPSLGPRRPRSASVK